MTVPLELVRQKRIALTDAALIQLFGEDYCLLTGLITSTTSASLSKTTLTEALVHHGHGNTHGRVSSAAPTSAGKPLSHHPTTAATTPVTNSATTSATTSNTLDKDVDISFMQIYRAGVWALLSVLVAVLADRLAMGWYGSNNPR